MSFPQLSYKRLLILVLGTFSLSVCLTSTRKMQLSCPEDIQAALYKGLHGQKLTSPANSHMSEQESRFPSFKMTINSNFMRDPQLE